MKTLNAKTIVATLAAAAAVTAAAPAMAQPHGHGRYEAHRVDRGHANVNQLQARIEQTIRIGERRGDLTRNEARVLRTNAQDIARLEMRYRAGGLNIRERQDLNRRLVQLENAVHLNMRDFQIARR
ncbi:MAG: hypothetical protein U1C74_12760 [Phenylobacterium sp.]|nr:hypothetical protein [Phenylobacterium sp.]